MLWLQPGLNALVGRNGIGKTNLLSAIRLALGPSASRGDSIWLEPEDFFKKSPDDKEERTIQVNLTFSNLNEDQRAYFFEIMDFDLVKVEKSEARIRFEAIWPKGKKHPSIKRTGGPAGPDAAEAPSQLLESLPITFLPALRDAEASLTPGYRSRLAMLLKDLASKGEGSPEDDIKAIFSAANLGLEQHALIQKTRLSLQKTNWQIAGTDYSPAGIRASEMNFERILRTLQIHMEDAPIGSLDANGLGLNNLIYISVILEYLRNPDPTEVPLLLVEEPEAHLHPQLIESLAAYLAKQVPGRNAAPQTIVTTHSPTLAAAVMPSQTHVLFTQITDQKIRCNSLSTIGLTDKEERSLQRMMDVTRASLYFARGILLVEGISEALLIPALAKRMGYDLRQRHISVIPICGVAFDTFEKLLTPEGLNVPTSIVTDADPGVVRGDSWHEDFPAPNAMGDGYAISERTQKLVEKHAGNTTIRVFHSKVTLEYDLAEANDGNAEVMAMAWEDCFTGQPGTYNQRLAADSGPRPQDKALAAWQGICRAEHKGSKADFAHQLADRLLGETTPGAWSHEFTIPTYLAEAIKHVVSQVPLRAEPTEVTPG